MGSSGGIRRLRRRVSRLLLLLLLAASTGGPTARAREAQPLPEAAAAGTRRAPERHGLSLDFYAKTCPAVDQIVANVTAARYRDFPAAGPAVLRLFHHDCFVEVRRRGRRGNSCSSSCSHFATPPNLSCIELHCVQLSRP